MSMNAYNIAIKISLVEGVTRGLQLLSSHFKTTDAEAAKLEARLKSIGKMAAVGGALMGAGFGGLAMLKGPLDEAAKYQTLIERFKQFGMGDAAQRDAEKFVAAQNIMGASQRDMMRYFIEAQGVFRESGNKTVSEQLAAAKMAAPLMAKMNFAMAGLSESARHATEAKQMDMLRFVEQAGGLKSSQRFGELLDSGFRAVQSSGGNVDFSQYRQFMSRGGSAATNLSTRALFADLEPIIGEMKGSTAGNALMTSFNRLNGIVKLPNQVAHELVKNGLWNGSNIQWNSQGGIKQFNGNPMVNSKLFGSDPIEYYRTMVQPMYAKMGLDASQRVVENAKIFGRTGGAMFNLIEKQMPTILRSRKAYDESKGITPEYEAVGNTYAGREAALTAKWQTLLLVIGKDGGILDMATKGLGFLGSALSKVIGFAKEHPTLTKLAFAGVAVISVLAIIGGALTTLGAAFSGLMLLAGPLSLGLGTLAIGFAAIGAAAWLVYNNWTEIKRSLKVIFSDIYQGVVKLFQGDIMGALGKFWHSFAMSMQVTLNTLIAGIDAILPKALQIGKFNFADAGPQTGAKPGVRPSSGSPYIRPAGGPMIQVHTTTNVDGVPIARTVSKHMVKEFSRPNNGALTADWNRAPTYHGAMAPR